MARDSAEHLSDETGRQLSRVEKQLKENQEALSQSSHEVCSLHFIPSLPSACLMCCCTNLLGQYANSYQNWMLTFNKGHNTSSEGKHLLNSGLPLHSAQLLCVSFTALQSGA